MNNYLDDLIKYLKETPRETILKEWAKSEDFDNIGPTFNDFIRNTEFFAFDNKLNSPPSIAIESINNLLSPKYPSGSFF